jgi:hypothetical protein
MRKHMSENETPKEPQEATYTFTLTVTRKGPGIVSKASWLELKRTVHTKHIIWGLLVMIALIIVFVLADRFYAPPPINLPMPALRRLPSPEQANDQIPSKIAVSTPTLGDNRDVITPLNVRDPAALVLPPSNLH